MDDPHLLVRVPEKSNDEHQAAKQATCAGGLIEDHSTLVSIEFR